MKKKIVVLLIIGLVCFSGNAFSVTNSILDDINNFIKSIDSTNNINIGDDYRNLAKKLKSLNSVEELDSKEQEDLKISLLDVANKSERTIDPSLNAAVLSEAVRLFPKDLRLSVKLTKSYAELGQYKDAVNMLGEVLTQSGNKSKDYELTTANYATQGLGLMMVQKYKLAFKNFQTVIKREPNWTGGYFLIAAYYFRTEKYNAAAKYFRKCLELNPEHKGAASMLSMLKRDSKIR